MYVLNFTPKVAFSLLVRGRSFDWIVMPLARASAGIKERNSLAGFERGLKGLNATRTSVRNRVIMMAAVGWTTWRTVGCGGGRNLRNYLVMVCGIVLLLAYELSATVLPLNDR